MDIIDRILLWLNKKMDESLKRDEEREKLELIQEKKEKLSKLDTNSVKSYHLEKYVLIERDYDVDDNIRAFHYLLGVFFDGRIDEIKDIEIQIQEENSVGNDIVNKRFRDWFFSNKDDLLIANKISRKIEGSNNLILDKIKDNETIEECLDRILLSNKKFMKIYNHYSNLNPKELFLK